MNFPIGQLSHPIAMEIPHVVRRLSKVKGYKPVPEWLGSNSFSLTPPIHREKQIQKGSLDLLSVMPFQWTQVIKVISYPP